MPATLKRNGQVVVTPRALERQALHELDDGRLVLEHLSGDHQAFGTLVDRYQTRLLNFINRTIGDRERAEDLVQEVFIRVFRHLHRFDQTKKFSTWIYTIASNLAKNELRNRSRNPLVLFQTIKQHWEADHRPLQFEDTTARPDDLYRKRYLKEAVDQCVGQLPAHHRVVFVLRELEGKSYAEIADIPGCHRYDATVRRGVLALQAGQHAIVPSPGFRRRLESRLARERPGEPELPARAGLAAALLLAALLGLLALEGTRRTELAQTPSLPPVPFPKPVAHAGVPFVSFQDPRATVVVGNPSPYGAVRVEPVSAGR